MRNSEEPTNGIRWSDYRYKLISLLEIMKRIDAHRLVRLVTTLQRGEGYRDISLERGLDDPGLQADPSYRQLLLRDLLECRDACLDVDLPLSLMLVDELIQLVEDGLFRLDMGPVNYRELRRQFTRELSQRLFLVIDPAKVSFFRAPIEGWEEAIAGFSCRSDISEASMCLATDRHTACVFHLIRAVEHVLRLIGVKIGSTNPIPEWGALLGELDQKLAAGYKELDPIIRDDLPFFRDLSAQMHAFNRAWRRPVMHVGRDPVPEDEAREIYLAARGFMRHAATKLSD